MRPFCDDGPFVDRTDIARGTHNECLHAQKSHFGARRTCNHCCKVMQLVQDLPAAVNGLRATKPVKTEVVEVAPMPAARPKASAPKPAVPAPKPPAAPEPSYRTTSGRLSSSKKKALKAMIENVWKADSFGVFKLPVTKRIAPDYYDIVKHPMDLKTVRQNLDKGSYEDEHAFKHVRSIPAGRYSLTVSLAPLDSELI